MPVALTRARYRTPRHARLFQEAALRGSAPHPRRTPGHRRARTTTAGALATAALVLPLLGAAPSDAGASVAVTSAGTLQRAFASAAAEYHVPQSVLLGVSYLQSRWDGHAGAPSVTGGSGPMHLTDARTALASQPHHSEGTEDARGDSARPALLPETKVPTPTELPARLETLPKAAGLSGLSAGDLRTDPAANVAGGAALLAAAQKDLGEPLSQDPADWYGAVARFSGADDNATAAAEAHDVFDLMRTGVDGTKIAG